MKARALFRLLKGTTLLSLVLIFALLSLAEGVPWPAFGVLIIFLIRSWRRDTLEPDPKSKAQEIVWNVLAFGYLFLFLADIAFTHGLIAPVSRLLLFLVLYKVHTNKRPGEWRQLTFLAFLGLTAASALTTEFYYAPICLAFGVLALIQLTAQQLLFGLPQKSRNHLRYPALKGFLKPALLVVLLTALSGAFVFAVIPREEWAYFKRAPRNAAMAGFSDQLKLGHITQVKKQETVVFRAKVDVPLSSAHRWFGAAFNSFDGTQWSRESLQDVLGFGAGHAVPLADPQAGGRTVRQDIIIQPSFTGNLFHLPEATTLTMDMPGSLTRDRFGGIRLPAINRKTRYTIESSLRMVRGRPVRSVKIPPSRDYLSTPDLPLRVTMVLDELVLGHEDPWVLAEKAEETFRREFEYSLDVDHISETDPIGDFLQSRTTGFCEYFATAMTLGLRRRGVPARVVTGFLPGSRSPVSGQYVVKSSDAHAWVEAYIQGYGWVTFDPTPGPELGEAAVSIPTSTQVQAMVFDLVQLWDDHVIGFNFHHQLFLMDLYRSLAGKVKAMFEALQNLFTSLLGPLKGMATLLALLVMGLALAAFLGVLWLTWRTMRNLLRRREKHVLSKEGELVLKILREASSQGLLPPPLQTTPWISGPVESLALLEQRLHPQKAPTLAHAFARRAYSPNENHPGNLERALRTLLKTLIRNRDQQPVSAPAP